AITARRLIGIDEKQIKRVDSRRAAAYIGCAPSPGGGIGRRARFRSVCREAWRFESSPGHQKSLVFLVIFLALVTVGTAGHSPVSRNRPRQNLFVRLLFACRRLASFRAD